MSDTPETPDETPPVPEHSIMIPLIPLENVKIRIDDQGNGVKMLVIGPIAIGVPFNPEGEKWLREQLNGSGIQIAGMHDLQRL